jgi:5-methylcytosine-specific restriction endonuclease McrA
MKNLVIWEEQGRKCNLCEETDPTLMTLDHITRITDAKKLGWTTYQINARENLQILCLPCHQKKDKWVPRVRRVTVVVPITKKKGDTDPFALLDKSPMLSKGWVFNEDKGCWEKRHNFPEIAKVIEEE